MKSENDRPQTPAANWAAKSQNPKQNPQTNRTPKLKNPDLIYGIIVLTVWCKSETRKYCARCPLPPSKLSFPLGLGAWAFFPPSLPPNSRGGGASLHANRVTHRCRWQFIFPRAIPVVTPLVPSLGAKHAATPVFISHKTRTTHSSLALSLPPPARTRPCCSSSQE